MMRLVLARATVTLAAALALACAAALALPAHADRNIVFSESRFRWSGHFYRSAYGGKPEETVEAIGSSRLYRINPDGSGRTLLRTGNLEAGGPVWSPDGHSILVEGWPSDRRDNDASVPALYAVAENGGQPRRLFSLSQVGLRDAEWPLHYEWSPNGQWVSVLVRDYNGTARGGTDDFSAFLVNVRTGRLRKLSHTFELAWSPDSARLYLNDEDASGRIYNVRTQRSTPVTVAVVAPCWIDNNTLVADKGEDHGRQRYLVWISATGKEVKRSPLRQAGDGIRYYPHLGDAWKHRCPHHPGVLLVETFQSRSDGGYYLCFGLDYRRAEVRYVRYGDFLGFSPDGKQYATSSHEWVGPYKRGGARLGSLRVLPFLGHGAARTLTGQMVSINGGDWRRPVR